MISDHYFTTSLGNIVLGDSLEILRACVADDSVDLIVTSPPYALVRKKEYGGADASEYLEWFRPFAIEFHRVLRDTGSLVINIGGAWNKGFPTRSLVHLKLPVMLVEEHRFHLCQEIFWYNPARIPGPAEWVCIRRNRLKDSVEMVWWLGKTPWPRSSNRRLSIPYSASMQALIKEGNKAQSRPSGHLVTTKISRDNGSAICPNLLAIANTESGSSYLRRCRSKGIKAHPARFPAALPEAFIRMLTDPGDLVIDPFAGSCTTGKVCEDLGRRWICCEREEEYLRGAIERFSGNQDAGSRENPTKYELSHPGVLWSQMVDAPLSPDGGRYFRRDNARSQRTSI